MKRPEIENIETLVYCPTVSDAIKIKAIKEYKKINEFIYQLEVENKKLKSQAVMIDISDPFEYILHQNNNKDTYSYNPQWASGEILNDFLLNPDREKDITQ